MPRMNAAYAENVTSRLAALSPDRQPEWGKMTVPQLHGHLTAVVRYSMGDGEAMPVRGNWRSKYIFRPLILNGVVKIPRNIKIPRPKGKPAPPMPEGTLEDLVIAMARFNEAQTEPSGPSHPHPFFGHLGLAGWAKFHYRHFEHHLQQFGV